MTVDLQRLLDRYAKVLLIGGLVTAIAAVATDLRWLLQPITTVILTTAVIMLRVTPVRLSKYSYLTQSSIPALVGAACIGPTRVVVALWAGSVHFGRRVVAETRVCRSGERGKGSPRLRRGVWPIRSGAHVDPKS